MALVQLLPPLLCLTLSPVIQTSTRMMPMERHACEHFTAARDTKLCLLAAAMLKEKHFIDPPAILPLFYTPPVLTLAAALAPVQTLCVKCPPPAGVAANSVNVSVGRGQSTMAQKQRCVYCGRHFRSLPRHLEKTPRPPAGCELCPGASAHPW